MAHKITEACLACGTCVPECPVEAITEGDPIYIIDAGKCTDCGARASARPKR
jgi:ferredoxin